MKSLVDKKIKDNNKATGRAWVLTIYTEQLEILVGKWNGMYHSVWNVSEIIGYWLNQSTFFLCLNFPIDTGTFYGFSILRLHKLHYLIILRKISTRMDRVSGKRPWWSEALSRDNGNRKFARWRSEHAHLGNYQPPNLLRMFSTENSYLEL